MGGATNTCTYGSLSYVTGKCGFGPSCQIVPNAATTFGTTAGVTLRFQNFLATPLGSVSLNCGNGQTRSLTCVGSSGNCSTTCAYNTSGTFSPSASIQGTACTSFSLTVTGGSAVAPQATTTTQSQQISTATRRSTNVLTCSLAGGQGAVTGDRVEVRIAYSRSALSPGPTTVNCGDGGTAVAPSCVSDLAGSGQCSARCVFEVAGNYTATAAIRGVQCSQAEISIAQGEEEEAAPLVSSNEANLTVTNFATSPAVIIEDAVTRITALVRSDQAVISAVCTPIGSQERSCSCTLSSTTEPNPVVDCNVEPPVNGRYQITFTAQDGKTKNAEVTLTPGESGTIEIVNRQSDSTVLYVVGLVALLLLCYAGYFIYSKINAKLTYKDKLIKRRQELLNEIDYTKMTYMKRQLSQEQFQKIYNDKQKELTETNAKIAEAEKQQQKK